jgi:deazaflavin-dependent oxidoreductase (nitroreductase family)
MGASPEEVVMTEDQSAKAVRLPPRWFIRTAWKVHRGLYRISGGRFGLRRPRPGVWGMFRLTTTGRRSGQQRGVILGYLDDGPNLVTVAMNGWGAPEPAWWLNLQANPDAVVDLVGERRAVRARAATGDERERLWALWRRLEANLDDFAALRPSPTAVVVLEPRTGSS